MADKIDALVEASHLNPEPAFVAVFHVDGDQPARDHFAGVGLVPFGPELRTGQELVLAEALRA